MSETFDCLPERLLRHRLISRVVVLLQVRVGQRILHQDPLVRVEGEHSLQQVQGLAISGGVKFCPGDLWLVRQGLNVAASLLIDDTVEILLAWGTEDCKDVVELVKVVFSREDWSVGQHLREDTTHRPDVNRLGVAL